MRRSILILGLSAAALLVAGSSGLHRLLTSKSRAVQATRDADECDSLGAHIRALSELAIVAETASPPGNDVNSLIEAACRSVGLPTDRILKISPEPMQRVKDTPFSEQPTSLVMRQVTMAQVLSFLHALSSANHHTLIRKISLSVPHRTTGTNLWNADVVLVHRIYAGQD